MTPYFFLHFPYEALNFLTNRPRSDVAGAQAAYEGALARQSSYFKAHFNLATCHAAAGRWADAEPLLRAAVATRPRCGRARTALGEALLRVRPCCTEIMHA